MKKILSCLILLALSACQSNAALQSPAPTDVQAALPSPSREPTLAATAIPSTTPLPATPTPTIPPEPSPTPTAAITLPAALQAPPRYAEALEVAQEKNIVYTSPLTSDVVEQKLDIYHPVEKGNWPVVVIVPAIGNYRGTLTSMSLGKTIAGQGAVVVVPDVGTNDSYFVTIAAEENGVLLRQVQEEIICALRYAGARVDEFGGDPQNVVVLGTTGGALYGLDTALQGENVTSTWDKFAEKRGGPPPQTECTEKGDLPNVKALVSYMGYFYIEDLRQLDAELGDLMDPVLNAGGMPELKVTFLHKVDDVDSPLETTQQLEAALAAAGHEVELILVIPPSTYISSNGPELSWITNAILQYTNP